MQEEDQKMFKKNNLPYFTSLDPDLTRSSGGRDPLGMQSIWSAFGRRIVPNLATPVTQISGIKAVLLIHWLAETHLRDFLDGQDRKFRDFFRLMEGLIEYCLWDLSKKNESHIYFCFGTLALNTEPFAITRSDGRTVANGLYQYYRGTCRRANLLGKDWSVPDTVSLVLEKIWNEKVSKSLKKCLVEALSSSEIQFIPAKVFNNEKEIKKKLVALFNNEQLNNLLKQSILGSTPQKKLSKECCAMLLEQQTTDEPSEGWIKSRIEELFSNSEKKDSPTHSLLMDLVNVKICEPFLLVLQNCFDYMLASPGENLSKIAEKLAPFQKNILPIAKKFLSLETILVTSRMHEFIKLALAASNENIAGFLNALLEYHKIIMNERGRLPMVIEEGGRLVVSGSATVGKVEIEEQLRTAIPWRHDYYIRTAGEIYRQLYKDK